MKIKSSIPKLQQGGATPPFVSWNPIPDTPIAQPTAVPQQGSSTTEEDGLLSKEMVKILTENGLPSDVAYFTTQLQELYNDPVYRTSGKINTNTLSSRYLNIINKINSIKFGKEQYSQSISDLTKNGGINDIALTETGRLIVQNEDGQIDQISPDEYYKNLGEYRVLTNSDLAHMRAVDSSLAFDQSIFGILKNGIGAESIQTYINSAIQNIGTTTTRSEGFVSKKDGQIMNGLNEIYDNPEIQEALLSNGAYKITKENKNQLEQSQAALRYIYSTLPENAKAYLRGKAAVNGLDPKDGIQTILAQLMLSRQSATNTTNVSYEASLSKEQGLTQDSNKKRDNLTQAQALQNNWADDKRTITLNPGSNYQAVITDVSHWNTIADAKTGQPLSDLTLADLTSQSSVALAGDQNSIYLGNQKIDPQQATRIVVDTGKGISQATLPYLVNDADGSIQPNLGILKGIEEAEQEIQDRGGSEVITELEKRNIYSDKGVGLYYGIKDDPNFLANNNLGYNFYILTGVGSNTDDVIDSDNEYVVQLNKEQKQSWMPYINDVITADLKKGNSNYKYDAAGGFFSWGKGKLFSGNIYIASSKDRVSTTVNANAFSVPETVNYAENVVRRGTALNNPVISGDDALNY